MRTACLVLSAALLAPLAGCSKNAVLIPNSDESLNKTAVTFAEEAKTYFPYPAAMEKGGDAMARAEVGYMWNVITLVNYSGSDWENVELWANKQYVLPLAKVETGKTKRLSFKLIYNDQGQHLPMGGTMIDTLEIKRNGVMYNVPIQIGG